MRIDPIDAGPPNLELWTSEAAQDAQWDSFVASVPGGHHVQTSSWGQVKAVLGWSALRLIATSGREIVGGAQLLWRSAPLLGAVGYVPKGPLFTAHDSALQTLLLDSLVHEARRRHIRHLTIQPPTHGEGVVTELQSRGFRISSVPVAPVATSVLDLSPDLEVISAGMSRKTRYNVGLGARKGIVVRDGHESDLGAYYEMLQATATRQEFSAYPLHYFRTMWRLLEPTGNLKLFMALLGKEVVSGQLIVPFGDTVINKMSVWSGSHGSKRPNEVLQWHSIEWSKRNGYRYYDFEGIDERAVALVQRGEPIPDELKQTVTSFKLGFGGDAVSFPPALYLVRNRYLRWGYDTVFPRISESAVVKAAVGRYRSGYGGSGRRGG